MSETFNWHKEAERQWDSRSDMWGAKSRMMWEEGSRSSIIPFIKKHMAAGDTVDFGCGDGYGSYLLSLEGCNVTGVDLSKDMVDKANKRISSDVPLRFVQGDLTCLPFQDEQFDGGMAINSLEWTEVPAAGLKEMKRVLKTGGRLCIGLLGPTAMPRVNSYRRLYGEKVICNTMMPWELQKLAVENGWEVIDGEGVYKRGVEPHLIDTLDEDLKQSLTFMWLFILEKK
ncbi:class I SAM-dependent methyltransferase [Halobacillus litoralis]|uniref:class I SAM-dependent methyltransferase n=1 Tax=Halobacillus litoralis TaxID=45668 RepID=UPI001CD492E0|nr:class I SAM-dependent methyltransferase [Halobacillus litoralis]MCA1023880.1 class I SAM-dependent methyltransferase [Halobacillus litoralis]